MKTLTVFLLVILFWSSIVFCEDEEALDRHGIAFVKVGSYRGFTNFGSEYQKSFFVSRYASADWIKAKSICKSFDLELVSLETLSEYNEFMSLIDNHEFIKSSSFEYYHIDGMTATPYSPTDWYWTNSGQKVSFPITWAPNQPDFNGSNEYCLSIAPRQGFHDLPCVNYETSFICQRLDYFLQIRDN